MEFSFMESPLTDLVSFTYKTNHAPRCSGSAEGSSAGAVGFGLMPSWEDPPARVDTRNAKEEEEKREKEENTKRRRRQEK